MMILAFRTHTIQKFHGALQGCEDIVSPVLLRKFNYKCLPCHTGSQQQDGSSTQDS